MIFVMLGTQNNSFHRLLEEIEKNIENGTITDKVIAQAGYTKFDSNKMEVFDFKSSDEINKIQDKADLIITHGGVGSIISSLKKDKKVIAVPRMHEYEEHVNNHQFEIVKTFNDKGYIIGVNSVEELGEAIKKVKTFKPEKYISDNSKMLNMIEEFIDNA